MKTYYTVYEIDSSYNAESTNERILIYKDEFTNKLEALKYCEENTFRAYKLTILETYE